MLSQLKFYKLNNTFTSFLLRRISFDKVSIENIRYRTFSKFPLSPLSPLLFPLELLLGPIQTSITT